MTFFTGTVVNWVCGKDTPGNGVFDAVVFKCPNVLAEFCRIAVFFVSKRCCVVSVSCLEFIFIESDVCFCGVVVFTCYGSLVYDGWAEALFIEGAFVLSAAVACFRYFGVGCGGGARSLWV